MTEDDALVWRARAVVATTKYEDSDVEAYIVPLITGSVAEFTIEPMLPCIGDVDIMLHYSSVIAIPEGCSPPTQLPGEFDSRVEVCEIVDSQFPGYVYLHKTSMLAESVDDGMYNVVHCEPAWSTHHDDLRRHGPAVVGRLSTQSLALTQSHAGLGLVKSVLLADSVGCLRCLSWPPQAAAWPTRQRHYEWPDSATVDRVVGNGCDVVGVAHRRCRQDERMSRLSFSRAEVVLLNSWMPEQQIVYHLLRTFVKTERLTDSTAYINSGTGTLSNFHIKTLMLWACELQSRSWWTDDLNLVRICVELLHTLADWLIDARCQHYFIRNCNLFDRSENLLHDQASASRLGAVTEAGLCDWFIDNYKHRCARLCTISVLSLLKDLSATTPHIGMHYVVRLQNTVSEIVKRRLDMLPRLDCYNYSVIQDEIMKFATSWSLTLRSCLCWMNQLAKSDQALRLYFTAVAFLHVAHKTSQGFLTDEMLDVLATACLWFNDVRRCLNARHSSVLSLRQAAMLMKVIANNSRSTVQLIEIELSKAYLHRALRCKDSKSGSIYCLANVYLAVLYYTTGQYQTAIDHCTLVTRSQDRSQCSSHVVQGELLPRIDDQVDSSLGLALFYEYIRAAALNEKRERRHVSVFTSELFAHRLSFISAAKCHQLPRRSLADEILQYRKCLCNSSEIFTTDVIVFSLTHCSTYPPNEQLRTATPNGGETESLNTSKLVELLQQSAVEHFTSCRGLEARYFNSSIAFAVPDFEALYAYKCGQYRRCIELCARSVGDCWNTGPLVSRAGSVDGRRHRFARRTRRVSEP